MTRFLVSAARIDAQKRWLACVFLWFFIAAVGFLFTVQPKVLRLKKIQMDVLAKEKQLELEKVKGRELTQIQGEVQKIRLEKERKEQELKQKQNLLKDHVSSGTPYLVSFFSSLAQFAKQGGAKFVSIRPVDGASPAAEGGKEAAFVAAGQKSVDIFLIGKYSVLSNVLYNLERLGVLTTVKQFHVKPSQQGYPLLELQMRLDVIFG